MEETQKHLLLISRRVPVVAAVSNVLPHDMRKPGKSRQRNQPPREFSAHHMKTYSAAAFTSSHVSHSPGGAETFFPKLHDHMDFATVSITPQPARYRSANKGPMSRDVCFSVTCSDTDGPETHALVRKHRQSEICRMRDP